MNFDNRNNIDRISRHIFVTPEFNKEINVVVNTMFPKLIDKHKKMILNGVIILIETVGIYFNQVNHKKKFLDQLKQNKHRDISGLILLLLPFINTATGQYDELTDFNDLYMKTQNGLPVDHINEAPKFKFSNVQYGRADNKTTQLTKFTDKFFYDNLFMLVETIKTVSNKLYVNWMDIVPAPVANDSNMLSTIYENLNDKCVNNKLMDIDVIKLLSNSPEYENLTENDISNSLYIGHIYETFTHNLYENIKNIKFLIYDTKKVDNESEPLIVLLNNYIDLSKIIQSDDDYEHLDDNLKQHFTSGFINFVDNVEGKKYTSNKYPIKTLRRVIVNVIFFFEKYHVYGKHDNIINDGYVGTFLSRKNKGEDKDDEDEDEEFNEHSMKAIKSARSLHDNNLIGHFYDHIKKSLNKFQKCMFYSDKIIDKKTNVIVKNYEYDKKFKINTSNPDVPKITLTLKNIYNFGKSLSYSERNTIMSPYWCSLSKQQKNMILNRLNGKIDNMQWFNIRLYIKMYYGVSDSDTLNYINNELYKMIKNNMASIIVDGMSANGTLNLFYPNDKMTDEKLLGANPPDKIAAQFKQKYLISKSKHFAENSIYYLTGTPYKTVFMPESDKRDAMSWFQFMANPRWSTWYAQYAMNWVSQINFYHRYLNNRIIYATGSTGVGKSTQIPKLLMYGLHTFNYKMDGSVICSQPRISPTSKNAIRIADELGVPISKSDTNEQKMRTKYVQYKYKEKKNSSNKLKTYDDTDDLCLKIVTDGLLSIETKNPLMKKQLKNLNYTTKNLYDIVIVDEAHEHNTNMDFILTQVKHASYYNNDLKLVIISATMDDDEPIYRRYYKCINDNKMFPLNSYIKENKIDRVNIDRRCHIGIGQDTKFKIDEVYRPGEDPTELTIKIALTTPSVSGDILLFEPGTKEIMDAVNEINKRVSCDTIAIPFHSELDDDVKKFVDDIAENKFKIKLRKDQTFEHIDEITDGKVVNKYKRVIVVATNIAEASITIPTLGYLVETGTQKTSIYDPTKDFTAPSLQLTTISESSRLQRKGRVGRSRAGTAYFAYEKGKMQNIVSKYQISISDIKLQLFDRLLYDEEVAPLFKENNDPNINHSNINNNSYEEDIKRIIVKQYFLDNVYYNYYGNKNDFNYDMMPMLRPYDNIDGTYIFDAINDTNGIFYIIHPEEGDIKRNIFGEIISVSSSEIKYDKTNKEINSNKMNVFWLLLIQNDLIQKPNRYYVVSIYGKHIKELYNIYVDYDDKFENFMCLYFSIKYDCNDDMIKLLAMTEALERGGLNDLQEYGKYYKNNLPYIKNMFGKTKRSEFDVLINIANAALKYISLDDKIYNEESKDKDNDKDKLKEQQKEKTQTDLKTFCYYSNLNLRTMGIFVEKYLELKNKNKKIIEQKNKTTYKSRELSIEYSLRHFDYEHKKVHLCLMISYPYNFVQSINKSNNYFKIVNPSPVNIYSIPQLSQRNKNLQIIIDTMHIKKYMFYMKMNIINSSISFVSYVNPFMINFIYGKFSSRKQIKQKVRENFKNYKAANDKKYNEAVYMLKDIKTLFNDFKIR